MRELKIFMMMIASLALTVLLGSAGCSESHAYRDHDERDRVAADPWDDNYRDVDRRDELHEDGGFDSGHDRSARGD